MKIFGKFRYVRPVKVGGERDVVPLEPSSVPPRSHADGVSHKVKGISWAVVTCCTRAVEAYFCSVVAAARRVPKLIVASNDQKDVKQTKRRNDGMTEKSLI